MTILDPRVELLRVGAIKRLELAMRGFGNVISETHRKGLHDLITGLAEQALGVGPGRHAYALPCGAGKTQAAVAVIAAAWLLGYRLTFAVSANTIKALVLFKRDLMGAGVPETAIGLRHGKSSKELDEELEGEKDVPPEARRDTGQDDRPIMLVSHSRLRGKDGDLFAQHKGQPRSLLIWDETMFVSDSGFVPLRALTSALAPIALHKAKAPELVRFIGAAVQAITAEAGGQSQGHAPEELDLAAGFDLDAAREEAAALATAGRDTVMGEALKVAKSLIDLSSRPLAVALSGSGGDAEAVIHYRIVVDPAYANIAVLDASFALRSLGQYSGIVDCTTDAMRNCKRFDQLKVFQYLIPAGKSTQTGRGRNATRAAQQAAQVAVSIPAGEACLFVVAKDARKQLERVLRDHGIALSAKTPDGQPRFPILTWGRETSSNAYRHCKHVVLVGIHRRNMHDLAASAAGEADNLTRPTGHAELREILLSEMAHCVLQASNRGAIRVVKDGQAGAMTLHVIDAEKGLKGLLSPSMPWAAWTLKAPETKANAPRLVDTVMHAILAELASLPGSIDTVSCRELKRRVSMSILPRYLGEKVWSAARRAVEDYTLAMAWSGQGRQWRISGRSFVSAPALAKHLERV